MSDRVSRLNSLRNFTSRANTGRFGNKPTGQPERKTPGSGSIQRKPQFGQDRGGVASNAKNKKTPNLPSHKYSFDRGREYELEVQSNAFYSLREDSDKHGKLEMQDRAVQADSQQIKAQLGKHDLLRNKVRSKLMRQGKPTCPTNFFVDYPFFLIVIGWFIIGGCSFWVVKNKMLTLSEEHPRQWSVIGDEKLLDWDLQVAAENYFNH